MSGAPNAILSDIQARAERRRTQTRDAFWHELVRQSWQRAQEGADPAEARRWLERAHRLLPGDATILQDLATATLGSAGGDVGLIAQAGGLFERLAREFRSGAGWVGVAVAARLLGDGPGLAAAVGAALRCQVPNETLVALATAAVAETGAAGWCGLTIDGEVRASARGEVRLDDQPVAVTWSRGRARLPAGWRDANAIHVGHKGRALLGSPLPVDAIVRLEGFVERRGEDVVGWAWYPGDPDRDPTVLFREASIAVGAELTTPAADPAPLARPRALSRRRTRAVAVVGMDGRALLGSPVGALADVPSEGKWVDGSAGVPRVGRAAARVSVVVPVFRGASTTLACLQSVLATVPAGTAVRVVDDASPDRALVAGLGALAAEGRIEVIRLSHNAGFPGAANAGLRAAGADDVVLLNSDTLVPPGWLERLRAAAYSSAETGTATPLSNDATILSYPNVAGDNAVPDDEATRTLDSIAAAANGGEVVEIPTGVGFCMYLRRDCLEQTGLFREDCFAQGYGEENDWCMRARHLGWRHVAVPGLFVGHVGGHSFSASFGTARGALIRRNLAVLNRLHPGYDALVAAHVAADPLALHRRRMDAARWAEGRAGGAVLIVTHAGGGGVDRVIEQRRRAALAAGLRPIVLRPDAARPGQGWCVVAEAEFSNLRFDDLADLAAVLRPEQPQLLELHHRLGHRDDILQLADRLDIPVEFWMHDYASFCQRIALVSINRRYCGEPAVQGCIDCIADLGTLFEEEISMPALLARSAADLVRARRVVAPSHDAARRIARHFPGVCPVVVPWEDDAAWPALSPVPPSPPLRVCVVGAIGREKGFEVLLACVRDARDRALPIEFVVVGFTEDDERLLASGPVWITGEYQEADAVALIRAQGAHVAFLPSVWPETWCFALSRAWEAELPVAAFDLGAQAERIRGTGRGWVLPLGLGAAAINTALLARLAPP